MSSRSEITVSDYWKADHEVSRIEEMGEEEINGLPEEPSGVKAQVDLAIDQILGEQV